MIYDYISAEDIRQFKLLGKLEQIRSKEIIALVKTEWRYLNLLTLGELQSQFHKEVGLDDDASMPRNLLAFAILSTRYGEDRVLTAMDLLKIVPT